MTNFGDHNIKDNRDKNFMLKPIQMFNHPQWHPSTFSNDICLLKYNNIPYNDRVAPACIPRASDPDLEPGTVCYVAGWGLVKEGDKKTLLETVFWRILIK